MLSLFILTIMLLGYSLAHGEETEISEQLCDYDINNDNEVNVLDAVNLVDYIIN